MRLSSGILLMAIIAVSQYIDAGAFTVSRFHLLTRDTFTATDYQQHPVQCTISKGRLPLSIRFGPRELMRASQLTNQLGFVCGGTTLPCVTTNARTSRVQPYSSTILAALAPPKSLGQPFPIPFRLPEFQMPKLPALQSDTVDTIRQEMTQAADVSSKMVLQLYFDKFRHSRKVSFHEISSHSPAQKLLSFAQEHGISLSGHSGSSADLYDEIVSGPTQRPAKHQEALMTRDRPGEKRNRDVSALRLTPVDCTHTRLAKHQLIGREAEVTSASTVRRKDGSGATLDLLQSLGLSKDDSFCDMVRTLRLMGVDHRLDFTAYGGSVFPDVVLTDMRDEARLVLQLESEAMPEEDRAYMRIKREAMTLAGYQLLIVSGKEWNRLDNHSGRMALLATVLANKGFW